MRKLVSIWSVTMGLLSVAPASLAGPFLVHPDARGVQRVEVSLDSYSYAPDDEPWKAERRGEEPAIAVL